MRTSYLSLYRQARAKMWIAVTQEINIEIHNNLIGAKMYSLIKTKLIHKICNKCIKKFINFTSNICIALKFPE